LLFCHYFYCTIPVYNLLWLYNSGRIDLVLQTLPDADNWKQADLCPSTDPLRFVWSEEDGSYHEDHTAKDEVLDALEKNEHEESTKTTTSEYDEDNVTRYDFQSLVCKRRFIICVKHEFEDLISK